MPDLPTVLNTLFSGGDMTVFQATIDAVGTGVVTVHVNGGTFTDVPYIDHGVMLGGAFPSIGDQVYVLGRRGWGMICLGRAPAGPDRAVADPQTINWAPYALASRNTRVTTPNGTWLIPSDGSLAISPDNPDGSATSAGVWFYRRSEVVLPATYTLSSASFYVSFTGVTQVTPPLDWFYYELGLHSNDGPTDPAFLPLANLTQSFRVHGVTGQYVSLPLDWAVRLLNGTAKGLYIKALDTDMTVDGLAASLRLTVS